jgi:hypothetical protein
MARAPWRPRRRRMRGWPGGCGGCYGVGGWIGGLGGACGGVAVGGEGGEVLIGGETKRRGRDLHLLRCRPHGRRRVRLRTGRRDVLLRRHPILRRRRCQLCMVRIGTSTTTTVLSSRRRRRRCCWRVGCGGPLCCAHGVADRRSCERRRTGWVGGGCGRRCRCWRRRVVVARPRCIRHRRRRGRRRGRMQVGPCSTGIEFRARRAGGPAQVRRDAPGL